MRTLIFLTLIIVGFSSCKNQAESELKAENQTTQNESNNRSLLKWTTIKDKFPNQDIQQFDFKADGQPTNDFSAIKLDSLTFNELINKVKRYSEWKEYLEIFYFSKNRIENQEFGIFLVKREFNGTEYTFDLIQFDNNGEIKKIQTLANSWTAAECFGYTRAKLNLKSSQMLQEILQKCYDEEAENNEAVDSIVNLISLKNLEFKTLRTDTIK